MSITGDFSPSLQGNRANVDRWFRTVTTRGLLTSLGGLNVTGAANFNNLITGSSGITITGTTTFNTLITANAGLTVTGATTFNSLITGNAGLTLTNAGTVPLTMNATGGSPAPKIIMQIGGVTKYTIGCTNVANSFFISDPSGNPIIQQSSLSNSLWSAFNIVDDGTGGSIFGVDATPTVIELRGNIRLGIANVTNQIDIGTNGARAINLGNSASSLVVLGAVGINTSGSSATTVGNSSATTNISGALNINTSGSSAVIIGGGTYVGQITIGNTLNNLYPIVQGGVASNCALFVNSASSNGTYTYIGSSMSSKVAYGWNSTLGPDIFDFSNGGYDWLYGNGTKGYIRTYNNILDDGGTSGNLIALNLYSKGYVVSRYDKGVYWNNGAGPGGANYFHITSSTSGGLTFTDDANSFTPLSIDSTGKIISVGSGDPILALRRSSYLTNFVSRIRFVDDNTSGNYWELGTDIGGNKGGDLYFYGQGASGLGLVLQLTSKGYVYAGAGAPWYKTSETTLGAGNQTITASNILGFFIFSPTQTGNFIWTFDTGANLYAAFGSPAVGTTISFLLTNGTSFSCIFAFGTGVTNKLRVGSITNATLMCYARVTGTNTVDLISN